MSAPAGMRPSRHHGTPQPLPLDSRHLRLARAEATIYYELVAGLARHSTAAFETRTDAKRWADKVHPDAELAEVTHSVHLDPDDPEAWEAVYTIVRRNGTWEEAPATQTG